MAIALRYAARSDVGLVRSNNQDSGYAGPTLLVIADGMGGHAGGDIASSLAIGEIAPLDAEEHSADAVLGNLSESLRGVQRELIDRVAQEPALSGMGTTVTALLRTGGRLALAHIGDSRAYVLRDGQLTQITRDHTFVQRLVDDGRITPAEAEQHPQRSVLMRVLSDVMDDVEPDLSMREARVGDRYLLCSDGLSAVVSFDTMRDTLDAGRDPAATCEQLVQLALRGGAPDNVTCIVADIVDAAATPTDSVPVVVGAASLNQQTRTGPGDSAAERAAELTGQPPPGGPDQPALPLESAPGGGRRRFFRLSLATVLVIVLLAAGGYGAYRWSQGQFFVGDASGTVAIFRGLPQDLGPIQLSSVASVAPDLRLNELPPSTQSKVQNGIVAHNENAAQTVVQQLRACKAEQAVQSATPTPSAVVPTIATPTTAPTPTGKPTKAPASKRAAQGDQAVGQSAAGATPPAGPTIGAGTSGVTGPGVAAGTETGTPTPTPTSGSGTAEDCRGLG